jgi:hypothetical protein
MRHDHVAQTAANGTLDVKIACVKCDETFTFNVTFAQYSAWMQNELVQVAFPEIPREDRELFVTGTCRNCYATMFGPRPGAEEEDEEDEPEDETTSEE